MLDETTDNARPNSFPNRRLTVLRGQRYLECIRDYEPFLRMPGKWLVNAGFHPGNKLRSTVESGKLEIRKEVYWRPNRLLSFDLLKNVFNPLNKRHGTSCLTY